MAKGKKGKSKTKTSSTLVSSATAADLPEYYYGTSTFNFPNGDKYVGDFCAHRAGLLWREGSGVYTTHDGHIYEGEWKEDRLIESQNVKICYPNGAEYFGNLLKGKYSGGGLYTLPNGMVISSNFSENKPTKETTLIDPLDKLWCGYTKTNADCTYLLPENELYLNIDENRGKGLHKMKPKTPEKQLEPEDRSIIEEEEEKIVFAKSTKTRDSLHFEDSPWYKRYATYKERHDAIKQKITDEGLAALDEDDAKWWTKYETFKKRKKILEKHKDAKPKEVSLLEIWQSKEFQERCPAVKVFYPSKQPGDEEANERKTNESTSVAEGNGEERREQRLERVYEQLKRMKEEKENQWKQKYIRPGKGETSEIYDRKLDKTKNPNCNCGKRVCECLLTCI